MYTGSCLCGAVKYEVKAGLGTAVYCHCKRCRKAGGSAFASNAVVNESDFHITEGASTLKTFSTDQGVHRMFCSACGSPIISRRDSGPGVLRLRLGTLDTPISERPQAHIFVAYKADWHEIHDDLPQHAERM